MGIKRNKSVLIHLKQEDMPRSETKEKEYYMGKNVLKKVCGFQTIFGKV